MKNNQKNIIELVVIAGPTAIGKSKIAIMVAKEINGEIISADSMQIYKGMDIGTAKPTKEQRELVKHHLIDIKNPDEPFDVNTYQYLVRNAITEIKNRKKVPVLTGGTGLYIRAILKPLKFPPKDLSGKIRKELENTAKTKGAAFLFGELRKHDPVASQKIEATDKRRIIRALEVIKITGKPFSTAYHDWKARESAFKYMMFCLRAPREILYDKINQRVDAMLKQGLIEEVESLTNKGFRKALTAGQAIGYKEIIRYLDGEISLDKAAENIKTTTRNYAKRQMTWFRSEPKVVWIEVDKNDAWQAAASIVDKIKN